MSPYNFEHEKYLRAKILNLETKPEIKKQTKNSRTYFNDLKEGLLHKYGDMELEDLKGYGEFENEYGVGVKFTQEDKKRKFQIKSNPEKLQTNLKLIKGIGIKKEEKLKKQGYQTLKDLKQHNTYKKSAEETLKKIETDNFKNTVNCVKENSKDKTDLLECLGNIPTENFKFMDIETLGLSNTHIILLGIAEIRNNKIFSTQYFLKDYKDEPTILKEYFKHIGSDSVLVTFNGKKFDVPFIDNRSRRYRLETHPDLVHYDLMYYARNIWGDTLPNCKLQTIESEIFNYHREDDVPGEYVPDFWRTYNEMGNIGPIIPIIKHNRIDIVNLTCFLMKMCETRGL